MSLQKGLIGHWTMDNADTSGGTLYDRSAYDNHGTIQGGVTSNSSGIVNESFDFDGSSGHIEIPFSHNKDSVTICGWINEDSKSDWARLIDIGQNSDNYVFLSPHSGSGNTVAEISVGTNKTRAEVSDTLNTNEWNHLAGTYDGSTLTLYINGSNVASPSVPDDISGIDYSNSKIGESFYSDPYIDGQVDDVRVYNRELSAAEVNQLYQMRSPKTQRDPLSKSIVSHWTFDSEDVNDPTALDSSSSDNHGTLNGTYTIGNSSPIGESVYFDGTSGSEMTTSQSIDIGTSPFTVSTWVYPYSVSGFLHLLSHDNQLDFAAKTSGSSSSEGVPYLVYNGQTTDIDNTSGALDVNQWNFIVYRYDGSQIDIFKNATNITTKTESAIDIPPASFQVQGSNDEFVEAEHSDTRLYLRALSDKEIQNLYNKRQ